MDPITKLSQQELRDALSAKIEVPANASLSDLQEMYSSIIAGDTLNDLDQALDVVQFPTHPASALTDSTLEILSRFDFRDGARFIRDSALSTRQRCEVIHLMASLVTFGSRTIHSASWIQRPDSWFK